MADVSQIKLPNGSVYDLIDEKSGYITAAYIENKTDYEIPVSRVGEIVVGETAIGTDSTNFPTSKAVVDYVDERVVQEMDAIDVGVTGIKANGTSLSVENGVVNIPAFGPNQSAGLMTRDVLDSINDYIRHSIPTSTSQLDNDSGFITSETDPTVPAWAKASTKPTYTASEVGALPDSTVITDEKLKVSLTSDNGTYYPILTSNSTDAQTKLRYYGLDFVIASSGAQLRIGDTSLSAPKMGKLTLTKHTFYTTIEPSNNGRSNTITLPNKTGTVALLDDIPTVPTNISSFTNDSGYLTASDIASVMIYKGTKANYAALPASGNTTGDVWHLTDTGAEWAWDGSAWQELGTAIDLSGYATKATTLAGYGITDAKIQNGTITLGSNTITPLTSYTETDPTVPSWAKQSSKPTYTAAEVGALPDSTVIPSKVSDLTNDSGFITSYTDEKVKTIVDSQRTYYLTGSIKSSVEATETLIKHPSAHIYVSGDSITRGYTTLSLGNDVATSEIGGKSGKLNLYSTSSNAIILTPVTGVTADRTITLPDKNGTIALTSDIPSVPTKVSDLTNDSGFITSYTETDPIFSASAAAGITSTDINSWNGKSDTDEKLSVTSNSTVGSYYPILDTGASGVASTKKRDGFLKFSRSSSTQGVLSIGENGSAIGQLRLFTTTSGKYVTITPDTLTSTRTITLPDATGTVALTSDIPDTSSFLTSETDPVFSASAAAGITSTDISNWNEKLDTSYTGSLNTLTASYTSDNGGMLTVTGTNSAETAGTAINLTQSLRLFSIGTANQLIELNIGESGLHTYVNTDSSGISIFSIDTTNNTVTLHNLVTPTANTDAANKKYVDDSIPKVYSSTNTGGYLTMATLPIYDGTVV